jgi:hypothetical protein
VASGISRDDYISDEVHEDQNQFAVGDYTRRFAEATYKPCNPPIADCWLLSCAKGLVMILTFVRVMPLTFWNTPMIQRSGFWKQAGTRRRARFQ